MKKTIQETTKTTAVHYAEKIHAVMLELFDEPMDGDQTELLAIAIREELDKLNGNQ